MKLILFGILVAALSNSSADDVICELFDGNSNSVEYYCEHFHNLLPEDCTEKSVRNTLHKDLSKQVTSDVKWLKIGGCDPTTALNTIRRYKNLRKLDISHSAFNSLDWFDVQLNGLEVFHASNNQLSITPSNLFNNLPQLTEIDLSFNRFEKIESNTFNGAAHLKKIDLSHNQISSIARDAFPNLTNLEFVDLGYNLLNEIYGTFVENKNLHVNLRHSPITGFACSNFKGYFVQMTIDDLDHFSTICDDFKFKVIRNGKKAGLFGISPGNYEIHCSDRSLKKINYLKSGRNSIDNLHELIACAGPSLRVLHIVDHAVGSLNSSTLDTFPNLYWLTLHNSSLVEFDFGALKYPEKIEQLHISFNHLKRLKNIKLLSNFERLETFKTAENQLTNVAELIDALPISIQSLDLSGNDVGQLNATTFERFTNLARLRLDNAKLSFTDCDPFENLPLHSLDISNNNLNYLNFSLLSKTLYRTGRFSAVNCQINNISDVILHLGPELKVLSLSENNVGDPNEGGTFNIPLDSFQHQTKMISLNVSYCHLSKFDIRALPKTLWSFDVTGNDLTEMKNLERTLLPELTHMSLRKNQFSCEYLTRVMKEWQDVKFNDNQWDQKHGQDCRPKNENTTEKSTK